jgi:hypothetical protein
VEGSIERIPDAPIARPMTAQVRPNLSNRPGIAERCDTSTTGMLPHTRDDTARRLDMNRNRRDS